MSVPFPATEELFTITVRKHLNAAPDKMWRNTYELYNRGGGTATQLRAAADHFSSFESMLIYNNATVDQVTISTWVPDGEPYDPTSFITIPYSELGQRALGTNQPLDLDVCWYVRRAVAFGRTGKLFFRSALSEIDVTSEGGKWVLQSPSTMETTLSEALDGSLVAQYMGGSSPFDLCMVAWPVDASGFGRDVISLESAGARNVKMNHVYFDLGTPATPLMVEALAERGIDIVEGQRVKTGRKPTKKRKAREGTQEPLGGFVVLPGGRPTQASPVGVLDGAALPKAKR